MMYNASIKGQLGPYPGRNIHLGVQACQLCRCRHLRVGNLSSNLAQLPFQVLILNAGFSAEMELLEVGRRLQISGEPHDC